MKLCKMTILVNAYTKMCLVPYKWGHCLIFKYNYNKADKETKQYWQIKNKIYNNRQIKDKICYKVKYFDLTVYKCRLSV